ncbi:MAG: phosphoglucosamine mutase [Planctomycetales bacterium]|nr:phosphoglucosamine mutase [Planctomycetales bacterium]
MEEPIISVSGLRGIIGHSLSPDLASRYARAFAATLQAGPIVLARDGRATGPMLVDAIRAGLLAEGRDCIEAGVAATPTLGVLVRAHSAAGGVQVSASHNPPAYNGLKAFGADGRVIPAVAGQKVIEKYHESRDHWVEHDRIGMSRSLEDSISAHFSKVAAIVDVPAIRRRKYSVVLDSNHGAGSVLGEFLLRELGCNVVVLGGEPHGHFAHPPEPTAENLVGVAATIRDAQADIGFCQDPDADRLAIIDGKGTYLGEEYTVAMCVDHVLRATPGPIVTNCSTSRMSEDLANKYGVPFFRAPVGEANVVDAMLANGAVFGGEGNGGPIEPRVGLVRDSFVGMALVLDAMAARDKSVAELAAELPRYEIHKTKVSVPKNKIAAAIDAVECAFPEASADRMDGLRLDWPGKWLQVRASNTEPICRAIAEAESLDEAQRLCDAANDILARV